MKEHLVEWIGALDEEIEFLTRESADQALVLTAGTRDPSSTSPGGVYVFLMADALRLREDAAGTLRAGNLEVPAMVVAHEGNRLSLLLESRDDLPERDPDGYKVLRQNQQDNPWANTDPDLPDANWRLELRSLKYFLDRVLWPAAYKTRALVVCFNAPFDLSRVAWNVGDPRTYKREESDQSNPFRGGFSFPLWSRNQRAPDGSRLESLNRARVAIKAIDSKRALKGFRSMRLGGPSASTLPAARRSQARSPLGSCWTSGIGSDIALSGQRLEVGTAR